MLSLLGPLMSRRARIRPRHVPSHGAAGTFCKCRTWTRQLYLCPAQSLQKDGLSGLKLFVFLTNSMCNERFQHLVHPFAASIWPFGPCRCAR